jgi:stage II sporulation protein D
MNRRQRKSAASLEIRSAGIAGPDRLPMRSRTCLLVLAAVALTAGPAAAGSACTTGCYAAPAGSGALFLFSGHGWGHGVGMSQYGAYGYALHGWTFQQILAHYYPGTTLGPAPVTTIRVLLADRKKTLKVSSEAPFTVRDGTGAKHPLPAGTVTLGPGLQVAGEALEPPLSFLPAKGWPLSLARPYRGRIDVDVVDGKLRAVNVVPLEQYLYGVVPSEMPSTWSPAALQAQAVAARSYALATRQVGAPYDVYSDTRSQMYLGVNAESPATTAAVNATKRQVVLYDGTVAATYFSSTSGGRTESSQGWTGTPLPYLVSVPDPYDDLSPYHNWGPVPVTAQSIVKALKLAEPVTDATTTPNATGRVAQVGFLTPFAPVTVPATKLRTAIGLRSTWFSVGVMSLAAPTPNAPVTYGSQVTLGGAVRGVSGVTLEARTAGGDWQPAASVPAGAVRMTETPSMTTDYRLATTTAAAGSVRIRVMPAVQVTSFTSSLVAGTVQPLLPSAPVQVQQQNPDLTWTTVATGAVAADGTFSLTVQLTPGGTYRISVAPATGFAPAATPQVVVR